MINNYDHKKLIKTALCTSPLIAVMAVAPIAIVEPFKTSFILAAIAGFTLVVLFMWAVNWGLFYLVETYSYQEGTNNLQYVFSYLLTFMFVFIAESYFDPNGLEMNTFLTDPGWAIIFSLNTIILIIQNLYIAREKKAIVELENSRLKLKNAEAVNLQLKQQIHPHFLFNSLTTLKTLIKKKPRTATNYVVWLSRFLRSSLSSTNKNTIKLSKELNLCINYLEMQKIRFQSSLEYQLNIPDEVRDSGFVPPFSIQLLLENAIKHNYMSRESPLSIEIWHEEGWIHVQNNSNERKISEPSSGMGLDNLAERYQILSGDEVVIEPNVDQFLVRIKVLKKEQSVNPPVEHKTLTDQ